MPTDNFQTFALAIAISLIGGLFGILILLLGWLGSKIYAKMEEIGRDLKSMASELHTRITGLDNRLTRIEAVEELCPVNQARRKDDPRETN